MRISMTSVFVTLLAGTVVSAEPPPIIEPKFDGWERVAAGKGYDLYKYYPDAATGELGQVIRDLGSNAVGRQNNHFALVVDYRDGHVDQVIASAIGSGFSTWSMRKMWDHAQAIPGREARVLVSGTYFNYTNIEFSIDEVIGMVAVPTFGLKVNGVTLHRGLSAEINKHPNRKENLRMISFQKGSAEIIKWDDAAFDDPSKLNLVPAIDVSYETDGGTAGRHIFGLVDDHIAVHLLTIEMKQETAVNCLAAHFGVSKSRMVQLDGGASVRVVADEKVRLPIAGLNNAALNRPWRDLPHMFMFSD